MSAETLYQQLVDVHEAKPATYDPPAFLSSFRHKCAKQNDISKPIDLDEIYVTDTETTDLTLPSPDGDQDVTVTIAMIYREGTCKKCKCIARSRSPIFVDSAARPPLTGRMARR